MMLRSYIGNKKTDLQIRSRGIEKPNNQIRKYVRIAANVHLFLHKRKC
jgi:hypothetical protein